jgi:hypothetical protein
MRRRAAKLALLCCVPAWMYGQKPDRDAPQPQVVDPGGPGRAPSDAVALFNGKDMSGWTRVDGGPAQCQVANAVMSCRTGAGDIVSVEKFRSAQIHLEFAVPHMPEQKGQLKGNSGVYLHGCYEVQILDSYNNPTYPNGQCGAIYGVAAPLVNASRPPEQWQSFDIILRAPQCNAEGKVTTPATVTVLHNGVLIHERVTIPGPGPGCRFKNECEPRPLLLQDHSGFPNAPDTTMRFRNIWVRKLD